MRSKRYLKLKSAVDGKKAYAPEEAVELAQKTAGVKFDATLELHCRLGVNPKKGEEQVRGLLVFPHSFGKAKKVAAFVEAGKEDEAKEAGADLAGGEDLIAEIIKTGKIDFEVAVATPAMMPKLAKAAKILGPRGLMPNPKNETVGPNIKAMIIGLKKGRVAFKNDDAGNVHLAIGKVSFTKEKLLENLKAALEAIKKAKPSSSKGAYLQTVVLTSTMGPAIKLAV